MIKPNQRRDAEAFLDIDDPSATEMVIGHDGRPVRVVPDKCVVRVPMRLRDSATVAGQIAATNRAAIHDRVHSAFGLHRPGYRLSDAVDTSAAAQAYDEMCRASSEAWKAGPGQQLDANPPANAYGPYEERLLGTVCTLNGADGRLEASADGKWLICRPLDQRSDSASAVLDWRSGGLAQLMAEAERIKQEAWEAAMRDSEQAWQRLGSS